jgi:CRISPR-associated protein Cas1
MHLQNTLYVTAQGSKLCKERDCLKVKQESGTIATIPARALNGLVIFGRVTVTPFLLAYCAENGICVSWLTEQGKFLATFHGSVSGNVLLRRRQYRLADDEAASAALARAMLRGKIGNCRTVLRRAARERPDPVLDEACTRLSFCLKQLSSDLPLDQMRGQEGEAAGVYFGVFGRLITKPEFTFSGRNRRPPLDAVNALLSFYYTLLAHEVRGALEAVGLDSAVGFLHRDRPGRPGLALDMMEEFRPVMVDRLALSLINRGQLCSRDFQVLENGAVIFSDQARKKVVAAWQARKREEVEHPLFREKVPVGLLWHIQAELLARHVRGDLAEYQAFEVR